jgi:hypothetical protein
VKKSIAILALFLCCAAPCLAQQEIRVNPTSMNVYSQGATTVFLTYGNLGEYRPAETAWCGEVMPADPDLGLKCVPGTIYGSLPQRFNVSRASGTGGYTDIVSVPASVARKAYQAAASGENSEFYYVRRFVKPTGGTDQFVAVTMRLSGNGAGVPFSLTDVQLSFSAIKGPKAGGSDPLVLFVEPGGKIPPIRAEIKYTGTGRLKGRWEVVRPGDPLPDPRDLLSEASLPIEERGTQQRFTQLSRFNVFLAPGGRYTLAGPDPLRIPNRVPGQYFILLRVEASDDGENDSDLSDVGAGAGVVNGGGAAGFTMPVLRYMVGGGENAQRGADAQGQLSALSPYDGATIPAERPIDFSWSEMFQAAFYRLEIEDESGRSVLSAILKPGERNYRAPSWLKSKLGNGNLRWRVLALDQTGAQIVETPRQRLRLVIK